MEEKYITTISEFTSVLSDISGQGYSFFRGQNSILFHNLLPSLLRKDISGNRFYGDKADTSLINAFKIKSIPYLKHIPTNEWEWLLTAQHYGIPTRLLDWSQSALVALFFAVEDDMYKYIDEKDNPVVWALNPLALNGKAPFSQINDEVPNLMEDNEFLHTGLKEYYGLGKKKDIELYPIAIVGPRSNGRINAQKGVFTLFPLNGKPLEQMESSDDFLLKIIIDKDEKPIIKKQLFELGITYSTIFPELEFISKDILFEYSI